MKNKYVVISVNTLIIIGVILIIIFGKDQAWSDYCVCAFLAVLLVYNTLSVSRTMKYVEESVDSAERANRSKSDFISNMSHEIRTPINAILGMNEMIQRESRDSNVLEYSTNIQRAGTHLLGIISDILDFSKIEAGHMDLFESKYRMENILCELYTEIVIRSRVKGLKLNFIIDPMIPQGLIGDELKIKQIIINLLTNAVKYTEKGSVSLQIRMTGFDEDSVMLTISVRDTGIGIKAEEMDKLFSAFDRLDAEKTRSIEGSGLGLTITQRMLAMMDSELEVESTYGEGSRFYFTVTQKVYDWNRLGPFDPENDRGKDRVRLKNRNFFRAPDAKILVVDDMAMNLQVIVGLLKRTGMKIDVASSGEECIARMENTDYNVVLLDYRMPDMDGIQTLAALHEKYPQKIADTPIISLTASAVAGDREMMLEAGFNDYLTKPVNAVELEDMLVKYLPGELVRMTDDEDADTDGDMSGETGDDYEAIPEELFGVNLLNPMAGVDMCGDVEDYLGALKIYRRSVKEKSAKIEEALGAGDMDEYTLLVHSLKSTSRNIGAAGIGDLAATLELAGKKEDLETLNRLTPELIKQYRTLGDELDRIDLDV